MNKSPIRILFKKKVKGKNKKKQFNKNRE